MSSSAEEKAALVSHPLAVADATGLTNVHRIAITGVSQSVAVPAGWVGKFVRITNDSTSDVQLAFSRLAAATIVMDQIAAPGVGHASAGATIFAGSSRDARVRQGVLFLNFIGVSGYLEIEVSECPA